MASKFTPSYHDQKREYEANQFGKDLSTSIEQILLPVKAARSALELTQAQQQVANATRAAEAQAKTIQDQADAERGFSSHLDQLTKSGGKDEAIPTDISAAESKGRLEALFAFKRSKADDAVNLFDRLHEEKQREFDVAAKIHSDLGAEEWANPELQKEARLRYQISPLVGHGLSQEELHALPLGDRTVGDVLGDPTSYTNRGILKPAVFDSFASLVKTANADKRTDKEIEKANAISAAREATPADQAAAVREQKQDQTRLSFKALEQATREFNADPVAKTTLTTPEGQARLAQRAAQIVQQMTGQAPAAEVAPAAPTTTIRRDPKTGKSYEVDIATKKVIREVPAK